MTLDYLEADGLTYETNSVYARSGVDSEDRNPAAWMLRVHAASQQVDAMRPFLRDGEFQVSETSTIRSDEHV